MDVNGYFNTRSGEDAIAASSARQSFWRNYPVGCKHFGRMAKA